MKNKLHKIALTLFFVTGMILSLSIVTADSHGAPERGHHIWGELQVNGEDAPEGTVVEARLNGNVLQSTTTNDSIYSFTISDNQNNNRDGETITIFVEAVEGESIQFQNSEISNVSFSVNGVTFGDQEDDSSDDDSSGSSGSSGGSSGGGFGSVTTDVNETEENTTESSSESDQNSDSEDTTQETTQTTQNVTSDDSNTEEDVAEEETTEEPTQESNPILDAMTGFVTGVGDQASLTGGLFLILILTGLVGGYIYYNSKE